MRNAYWFLLVLLSLTVLCAPALAEDGRDCANGWHTFGEYEFDETRHWISCTGCGEIVETSNHRRTCLEDVCATCGASASEDGIVFDGNVIHHGIDWGNPDIWQHDQYTHWIDCPSCGEQADLGIHWASCENPDVCENCGATDVVIEWVSHSGINWNNPEAYEHDSMYHWTVCSDCGEIEKSPHNGSCTAPDVCAECQATNVTISYINHEGIDWNDPDRWQWNDNFHWTTCTACGSTAYLSEHSAFCDDSEVCSECSAKGVNISYINHETYGLEFDETKHWRYCVTCNERVYESEHYCYCDESDHCVGCDC